jgi:protein gp37
VSGNTKIEWATKVWNPLRGCTIRSKGCANCYAMYQANRYKGKGMPFEGLVRSTPSGPRWTGAITLVPKDLTKPLHWRKPARIFVNSMSDLFHEAVPFPYIAAMIGVMAACPQHVFLVLTKRPEVALEFFTWFDGHQNLNGSWPSRPQLAARYAQAATGERIESQTVQWLPPNIWFGVSAEDQDTADERIPRLLQCPGSVHWLSAEPLLSSIDLRAEWLPGSQLGRKLRWLVIGGESGPRARPIDIECIHMLVQQARAANVAVFVKQLGEVWARKLVSIPGSHRVRRQSLHKKGGDPADWPAALRVRQYLD